MSPSNLEGINTKCSKIPRQRRCYFSNNMRNIWTWQVFILSHVPETDPTAHVASIKFSMTSLHLTAGIHLLLRAHLCQAPKSWAANHPNLSKGTTRIWWLNPSSEDAWSREKERDQCSQGWFSVTPRKPLIAKLFHQVQGWNYKAAHTDRTQGFSQRATPASCSEAFSTLVSIKKCN